MKERIFAIDVLRGVSIFLVILIHSTYYFIESSQVVYLVWNVSQFCVPTFLFCAAYVYFQKDHQHFSSQTLPFWPQYLLYLRKRLLRLLTPYYLFLFFFFLLLVFINPLILTTTYVVASVFTIGGVDISWLVLLFIELTLLLPIVSLFLTKSKLISALFFGSCVLLAMPYPILPIPYKIMMWLPWSLMLYFTYWFSSIQTEKKKLLLFISSLVIVFAASYMFLTSTHHSLVFRDNKYPPNLYFLSYGMVCIVFLYLLAPFLKLLNKPLTFLSTYSYQIYFIHYFFLIWFASYKPFLLLPWWIFFGLILGVTLITLYVWLLISSLVKR